MEIRGTSKAADFVAGTPDTNSTDGIGITASAIRFRNAGNFSSTLSIHASRYTLESSTAFQAPTLYADTLKSTGNHTLASLGTGTLTVGAQSYGAVPLVVVGSSHASNYDAFQVQTSALAKSLSVNYQGYTALGNVTPTARLTFEAGSTAATGIVWGTDTNLYRNAADSLITDDALTVSGTLTASAAMAVGGTLTASGAILAGGGPAVTGAPTTVSGSTGWRMSFLTTGYAMGIAASTLALKSANWLSLFTNSNAANNGGNTTPDTNAIISLGYPGSKQTIFFGTDTNLYRDSANNLKTDDALTVVGGMPKLVLTQTSNRSTKGIGVVSNGSINGSETGAVVIQLPYAMTNYMHFVRISGYRFDSNGAFEIKLGFYNFTSGFLNSQYTFDGKAPFAVTLAKNTSTGNACIILGTVSTVWSYINFSVDAQLMFGVVPLTAYDGWTVSTVTDLSGYDTQTVVAQTVALDASNLTTGTVPTARLGTGTASASTWLKGNQTWASITSADISDATSANTVNMVVKRDGNGDITIRDMTAQSITGSAYTLLATGANNTSTGYNVQKRGATGDATAAVANGAELGYHGYYGWNGSAYGRGAYTIAYATEAYTTSGHGAKYGIYTVPTGSTVALVGLTVDQSQYVGIGLNNGIVSRLTLVGGTTAAEGITFGSDTNLYRSAVDTLKTDDSLVVAGTVTASDFVQTAPSSTTTVFQTLRRKSQTTDATPTNIQTVSLTASYAYGFTLRAIASQQTTTNYASIERKYFVKVSSGGAVTVTEIGTATIHRDGLSTADVSLVSATGAAQVTLTGEASKNIGWATTIEYEGVVY